jgi:polysaccharide export outer membrane protein
LGYVSVPTTRSRPFVGAAFVVLAAAGLLAGCAERRGGPIPYDVGTFGTPDAPKVATLDTDYKIAPLDTLMVKVFKMPELTGEYEVDLMGQISMPLIGNVDAVELTTAELDHQLTSRFSDKYLENPDVSVGVKASTRRSVTVDGAVKSSGSFPVNGPLTLMQAVALAGGTSEEANSRRVAVVRQISGKRQAAAFDLASIRKGESPDPAIYPGDIVVIDGSGIKSVQKQLLNSIPILSIFRPF